jgi:kynurenine formamidase
VAALQALDVRGKAVLLHTGWDAHWRTGRYFDGHPFLTAAGAEWLAGHGAALVGIDSLNIDDTADLRRSAHTTLLGRDIPVVEHLSGLAGLPDSSFRFFAVPVKVRGLGCCCDIKRSPPNCDVKGSPPWRHGRPSRCRARKWCGRGS